MGIAYTYSINPWFVKQIWRYETNLSTHDVEAKATYIYHLTQGAMHIDGVPRGI